jgi:hypothetical protein
MVDRRFPTTHSCIGVGCNDLARPVPIGRPPLIEQVPHGASSKSEAPRPPAQVPKKSKTTVTTGALEAVHKAVF